MNHPIDVSKSLEEGMATYSGILAWRNPKDRGAWWATIHGVADSQTLLKRPSTHAHITTSKIEKQNQNG